MRHRRAAALLVALTFVVAACGNRASDDTTPTTTGGGGGGGGGETTTTSGEPEVPMVGTLESPCGPGDGSVGGDPIQIATITDIGGPVPGLGQEMWDAMDAFVAYCNDLGGVNGRQLTLNKLDAALFAHREATQAACDSGAVALVGSGSVFDDAGAQVAVDCGLPDVAGYTTHPTHALATNVVQPLPNPTNKLAVGGARYLAEEYPDAIKEAGVLYAAIATTELQARRQMEGYGQVGFEFTYTGTTNIAEADYTPIAQAVKNANVKYLSHVSEGRQVALLAQALRQQGYFPEVFETNQSSYNQEFLAAGGSAIDGIVIPATTWPFEELDESPALQVYVDALARTKPGATPDALGVQAFSAGLLFATAAKAVDGDITRESLKAELEKIDSWDGGGMHGESNPAANEPTSCFAYLTVEGGQFVRLFPDEGFSCDEQNVVELTGDYGTGAS